MNHQVKHFIVQVSSLTKHLQLHTYPLLTIFSNCSIIKINNRVRIPSHKSHTKTISRSPTQCLHTKKKIKIEKNQQETFHLHVSGNMSRQWFRFHFLQDPRLKAN